MMASLPVERAFSTTFFISQGDRNWPFLMLTGLPWEAALTMKFVCRHRKAGVCSTSTTAATSASGVSSCTSVSTGTPMLAAHVVEHLQAALDAGAAEARARGAVRLVVGGLEDERDAERGGHFLELAGDVLGERRALDDAGTGDQEERPVGADLVARELHALAAARQLRRPRARAPRARSR